MIAQLFSFIKYVLHAASYGVMIAVVLLLVVPEFRLENATLSTLLEPSTQKQQPLSYARAVANAAPAVVNIYSREFQQSPRFGQNNQTTRLGLGSGVIMHSEGYILTNFHVVQNADLIEVLLQNGSTYAAELIGFDKFTDLAVLKVDAHNLPVIPQNPTQKSLVGDVVLAIGNPLNLGQTVTQGIISATGRNGLSNTSHLEFLQMDAAINDGNSGGALVNTNGELVGINSRKFTQSNPQLNIQGIFFSVPYQLAYKIMQKIIENGEVVRGYLGISARTYIDSFKGIVIDQITDNSPAQKAGLRKGDIIYQIEQTPITGMTHALDIIAETRPNTVLTFKIYRQNIQLDVPVTIEKAIAP
ncbi:trypsin-like peptidase domain-containing protein [Thalassotalea sp. PLHSN55]|uniref:trypsin-like peptidase domain-containing protein n=1 Tax=Thalassotalea sp. PLHSN55 TaxID=3435888 RepID=UPI003F84C375